MRRSDDCGSAGTTSIEIMASKWKPEDDQSQLREVYFRVDILKQKLVQKDYAFYRNYLPLILSYAGDSSPNSQCRYEYAGSNWKRFKIIHASGPVK